MGREDFFSDLLPPLRKALLRDAVEVRGPFLFFFSSRVRDSFFNKTSFF
jgi:hypothetical protein